MAEPVVVAKPSWIAKVRALFAWACSPAGRHDIGLVALAVYTVLHRVGL